MYEAAANAGVLDYRLLEQLKPFLSSIKPLPAVFDHNYVKKHRRPQRKEGQEQDGPGRAIARRHPRIQEDERRQPLIMMWCGPPRSFIEPTEVHQSLKAFEKGLREERRDDRALQIYAYASLKEGVPFANGAPNLTVDLPVMLELSRKKKRRSAAKTSRPVRH